MNVGQDSDPDRLIHAVRISILTYEREIVPFSPK